MNPFKINVTPPQNVADTDFEAYYPRINKNTAWALLNPYINDSCDKYIIPYIGETFFNTLITRSTANDVTAAETKALVLLKRATAYYTAMYAYPKEQDVFSDIGTSQHNAEHTNATPVAVYKSKLWDLTITADGHLDALLQFLEVRVKGGDTRFDTFKNSDEYNSGKVDLFTHTFDVQMFHNINNSRRVYLSLLPSLRDAVDLHIIPKIGVSTYNTIVTQFKAGTLTTLNAKLCTILQKAVVKYGIVIASDTEGLLFENNHPIRVVSNPEGMDNREVKIKERTLARNSARNAAENMATLYMGQITEHLEKNKATYTDYVTEIMASNNTGRRKNRIVSSTDTEGNAYGGIMI